MPTGCAPPRTPGRWRCGFVNAPIRPSQLITEQSVENALRVLLALGGSHQRADPPDRDRRAARHQDRPATASTRCPTRRRCWSTSSPPARATWRISTPPAACRRCCGSCATCCTRDAIDVTGTHARRPAARARFRRPPLYPRPRRAGLPGRRHRRAVRQPRPARRHPEAQRRHPCPVRDARRAAVVFDGLGRPRRPHRRPGARRHAGATCWC